jgi:hypothetical protein
MFRDGRSNDQTRVKQEEKDFVFSFDMEEAAVELQLFI